MPSSITHILQMPHAARIVLVASVAILAFVFIAQYGFGYDPCILCWYQRIPYAVTIILAGLAAMPRFHSHARALLGLCFLAFLINAGIAVFHTGVELKWWLGTSGCAIIPLNGAPIEDLRTRLLHTPTAKCDQITWTFFGFSMANYNIAVSLLLAFYSLLAAKKAK